VTSEKSDWLYCRIVDRGNLIMPRHAYWFGHVEFSSELEVNGRCSEALRESMRAYAVSESSDGWKRLIRARVILMDDAPAEAKHSGAVYLKEAVRLFNTYLAQLMPVRETEAGYLFDLRTRAVTPFEPVPAERNPVGISAMMDDHALHPQYILNMLLVTAPEIYGELGRAFRRCAHWRELAHDAEDESERLLLDWMAAECLAKLAEGDDISPRLLAAVGLPSGRPAKQLSATEAIALAALPTTRSWRKRLTRSLNAVRRARNRIVHSGYRHVDLMTMLSTEELAHAREVLPITTRCLSEMALMALNQGSRTLSQMWLTYPAPLAPNSVVERASWFLGRLECI
jgi:hypothetical protein